MSISERAQQVVAQIRRVFGTTTYPGDQNLVYDNSGNHLDCKHVRERFIGKTWHDVDMHMMDSARRGDLSFLSAQAFRYYLPGFLIATLITPNREDRCDETLLFHIAPHPTDEPDLLQDDFARIDGFTGDQRAAIRAFLVVYKDEYADLPDADIDLALRFWDSFC